MGSRCLSPLLSQDFSFSWAKLPFQETCTKLHTPANGEMWVSLTQDVRASSTLLASCRNPCIQGQLGAFTKALSLPPPQPTPPIAEGRC